MHYFNHAWRGTHIHTHTHAHRGNVALQTRLTWLHCQLTLPALMKINPQSKLRRKKKSCSSVKIILGSTDGIYKRLMRPSVIVIWCKLPIRMPLLSTYAFFQSPWWWKCPLICSLTWNTQMTTKIYAGYHKLVFFPPLQMHAAQRSSSFCAQSGAARL